MKSGDDPQVVVIRPVDRVVSNLLDPDLAMILADAVLEAWNEAEIVRIDLADCGSMTTSFGHMFFRRLFASVEFDDVRRKLQFEHSGRLMREVLRRSIAAAVHSTGKQSTDIDAQSRAGA